MKKLCLLFLSMALFLAGCSPSSPTEALDGEKWKEDWVLVGNILGIDTPEPFALLENKDILAAEGLYYAAWVTGNSIPYENTDSDTIELYDAQLYLLLNEATDEDAAKKSYQAWLASAENNYEVHSQDAVACNGQAYTLITYDCVGEDTPYKRGASALGVCGANTICAELTCTQGYEGDLTKMLTDFLNHCHYSSRVQAD